MYIYIWIGGGVDINATKKKSTSSSEVYDEDDQQNGNFAPRHISHNISLARPLSKGQKGISITMTLTPAQPQNQKINV